MSQTTYNLKMDAAKEGLLADNGPKDIIHGTPLVDVKVGKLVSLGAAQGQVIAPATAAAITTTQKGVVIASQDNENGASLANKPASLLKKGRIYVLPEDKANFALEGAVHVRYAGTGDRGSFLCAAVSSETAILPNAKFVELHGDFAVVELNLV